MWIRSQDKSFLKDVKEFIIHTRSKNLKGDKCDYVISSQEYTSLDFGVYSTEEKALKVLDMIEKKIIENNTIVCNEKDWARCVGKINCVFQMPQDDEVLGK